MDKKTLMINTDGGSRGNPGPAAYAFLAQENGKMICSSSGYMGVATNNQAEYTAVLKALEWLNETFDKDEKWGSIRFILDSELVSRQLSGQYKIKDEKMKNLSALVKSLEDKLPYVFSYESVRREYNQEADALVNKVLDENVTLSHLPQKSEL